MNFEVITPFLEPIADSFFDSSVNEIRINPNGTVYIERAGLVAPVEDVRIQRESLEFAVQNIAGLMNQELSEKQPTLDTRLEDGSRVAIIVPPVCTGGITMTVRRFPKRFTLADFVENGTLTEAQAGLLLSEALEGRNLLISGGTSTGKTSLLRAILDELPQHERILLVEKPSELKLSNEENRDLVRIEVRDETRYAPAFTARMAIAAALRQSPDRIVLGEVRGGEAFDFIDALNTGHGGSMTTVHANSAQGVMHRLATLVKRGSVDLPFDVITGEITSSIHTVVHLYRNRTTGQRSVREIVRVGEMGLEAV